MEKIDRKYAVIFIDRTGECLKEDVQHFTPEEIIDEYYSFVDQKRSFLQWNAYLVVAEEVVGDKINEIEKESHYTRKYVLPNNEIDSFINERFPEIGDKVGEIRLVKDTDWIRTEDAALKLQEELNNEFKLEESWYRNVGMLATLTYLDILRANLITKPNKKVIFYSHISKEINIAKKKFHLFLEQDKKTQDGE